MSHNRHDAAPGDSGGGKPEGEGQGNGGGLSDARVADYLRRNPDFLARHDDLLDVLEPPRRASGEGVVDLQQFMLDRLRGELAKLRAGQDDLIHAGRCNMVAQARVHEATLAILGAASFENLIERVTTDLAVILNLDAVTLCVEQVGEATGRTRVGGVLQLEPGTVQTILGPGRAHALLADIRGEPEIFGSAAGLVRSAALMRMEISSVTPPAMLALGSRTPGTFEPNQGSELLQFLTQALELTVRQWLELPE